MITVEKINTIGKDGVLEAVKANGIREYGVLNEDLAEKISGIAAKHEPMDGPMLAAGALNNCDYSGMLLEIVKKAPEKVLAGLYAVGKAVEAEALYLYVPEEETELAETLKAKAAEAGIDVTVEADIVNARLLRDGITCHVETLAAVADALEGAYEPKVLVSVVKYETSETVAEVKAPAYVAFGTALTEVTGDLAGVKAVGVGEKLVAPAAAAEMVITAETVLGDGVIKLYSENCCMVDLTTSKLLASRKKSCGKCTFCREGLIQLHTRMKEIVAGKGEQAGLDVMKEIAEAMTFSCSCTLGDFGSSLVLETFEMFMNEYNDHMAKHKCTAGTCLAFVNMYIDPKKCSGCGKCIPACEGNFIEGLPGYIHMIEDLDCIKCGKCIDVCPEDAVVRTTMRVPALPDRLTRVGRFKRY